jgi:hypothetical protein
LSDFEKIINRRSGIKMGGFAVYDLRFAVYDLRFSGGRFTVTIDGVYGLCVFNLLVLRRLACIF